MHDYMGWTFQVGRKHQQHRAYEGEHDKEVQGFPDPMAMDAGHRTNRSGRLAVAYGVKAMGITQVLEKGQRKGSSVFLFITYQNRTRSQKILCTAQP